METFYNGYIVNTIMAACSKADETKKWEAVKVSAKDKQTGKIRQIIQ